MNTKKRRVFSSLWAGVSCSFLFFSIILNTNWVHAEQSEEIEPFTKLVPTGKAGEGNAKFIASLKYLRIEAVNAIRAINPPPFIDRDDLISHAYLAYHSAWNRFDPNGGANFKTYASLRIRGAIIDELRAQDQLDKRSRSRQKKLRKTESKLTGELGRPPTDFELSEKLGISPDDLKLYQMGELVPHKDFSRMIEFVPDDSPPVDHFEELSEEFNWAIQEMTPIEKNIVRLKIFDGLTFKLIARTLSLSESKVYRMFTYTMERLGRSCELRLHRGFVTQGKTGT